MFVFSEMVTPDTSLSDSVPLIVMQLPAGDLEMKNSPLHPHKNPPLFQWKLRDLHATADPSLATENDLILAFCSVTPPPLRTKCVNFPHDLYICVESNTICFVSFIAQ